MLQSPLHIRKKVMENTAKKVRDTTAIDEAVRKEVVAEVRKQSSRRKLPTPDEVREEIMKIMPKLPCPV